MLHITELPSSLSWWFVFMTVSESHFNNWTVPDHELAKLILKIHILLITALLTTESIFVVKRRIVLMALIWKRRNSSVPQYIRENTFPTSDNSIQFYKPRLGGYKWLNWQECCKCHTKCQQGRKVTGTISPVQWQCQERDSVRRSESSDSLLGWFPVITGTQLLPTPVAVEKG